MKEEKTMQKFRFTPKQKRELLWWADRLDETPLAQGKGKLKRLIVAGEDAFCCLGIFAEYKRPNLWKDPHSYSLNSLPTPLARFLGFTSVRNHWLEDIFIMMNDVYTLSFHEIANEIRYLVEHKEFTPEITKRYFGVGVRG